MSSICASFLYRRWGAALVPCSETSFGHMSNNTADTANIEDAQQRGQYQRLGQTLKRPFDVEGSFFRCSDKNKEEGENTFLST